jgi:hypothetical protein
MCIVAKPALVLMRVPERQLLAAVRGAEGVVDVDDLLPARLHGDAELVDQRAAETRGLDFARRVLEAAVGRLRRQRRAGLGTPADGKLHQWALASGAISQVASSRGSAVAVSHEIAGGKHRSVALHAGWCMNENFLFVGRAPCLHRNRLRTPASQDLQGVPSPCS